MRSVVAGYDGSAGSAAAVRWAAREAQLRQVQLRVLTFLEGFDNPEVAPAADFGAVRAQLAPEVSALGADAARDQPLAYEVAAGSPPAGLVGACGQDDLLVVGSRGRNPLAELLLGSVSHACLHAAPCPVAIIPDGADGPGRQHRVVVGVDGSAPARRALTMGAGEARLRAATLRAVHAVQWLPIGAELVVPDDAQLISWGEALLAAELAEAQIAARPAVLAGHPGQVLVQQSADAELLVVGSRGRGPLLSLLAGSTADHCARHARCAVLITR